MRLIPCQIQTHPVYTDILYPGEDNTTIKHQKHTEPEFFTFAHLHSIISCFLPLHEYGLQCMWEEVFNKHPCNVLWSNQSIQLCDQEIWDCGGAIILPVSGPYLGSYRWAGLLQEIPQFPPLVRAAGVIKLSLSLPLPQSLCLPPQLLVHLFFFLVVTSLAAGLQVDLVNPPVV